MFTLRRITSESAEVNTILGSNYNLVYEDRNAEEFAKTLNIMKWQKKPDEIYGFIIYNDGSSIMPLYKKSTYFIMCSDGKTFSNITYK